MTQCARLTSAGLVPGESSSSCELFQLCSQTSLILCSMLYTHILQPPDHGPHTRTSDLSLAPRFSPLIRYFRTSMFLICITVEPVSVLDTRLPKLQVGPNMAKRKPGTVSGVVDSLATGDAEGTVEREIKTTFQGLSTRVDSLVSPYPAPKN